MNSFLKLLKTNGAIVLIGLLIGLVGGFKLANAKYRKEQVKVLNAQAAQAAANLGKPQGSGADPHGAGQAQNQVNEAIERARANPNDYEAQIEAADQYLQIQRPQIALEFLDKALKLKPTDPRAMTAQSTAYLLLGNFAESERWARQALKQKPEDMGARLLLVLSLIEARQKLGEAEQLLGQLEKIRPGDQVLANARASLNEAKAVGSGQANAPKTVLEHGPAAAPPPKPEAGGRQ
jgi:tetratricopeptide (TPR) repeat protein